MKAECTIVSVVLGVVLLSGCGEWPGADATSARPDPDPMISDTVPRDNQPRDTVSGDTIPDSQNRGSAEPVPPTLGGIQSAGNVTTYGDVESPAPSRGGACNYGDTDILNFAAINVDAMPGDAQGEWQGGKACGQCAEVAITTSAGTRSTVVRIVDKCHDANCGIDVGGLPADALMNGRPGRYSGSWKWVACGGSPGVSDGPPTLYVKEGGNPFWSLVQVRNPPGAVLSVAWSAGGESGVFAYAAEAENFFKVPQEVLEAAGPVAVTVEFTFGGPLGTRLNARELSSERASYPLEPRP